MKRHSQLLGVLGCAATLAIVGCAGPGGTAPTTGATTARFGPVRVAHFMPTRYAARAVVPSGVLFSYYDGPVLVTPKVYIIFWGYKKYGDPERVAPLLRAYIKTVGGSAHDAIYTQYYEIVGGKTIYITNPF